MPTTSQSPLTRSIPTSHLFFQTLPVPPVFPPMVGSYPVPEFKMGTLIIPGGNSGGGNQGSFILPGPPPPLVTPAPGPLPGPPGSEPPGPGPLPGLSSGPSGESVGSPRFLTFLVSNVITADALPTSLTATTLYDVSFLGLTVTSAAKV